MKTTNRLLLVLMILSATIVHQNGWAQDQGLTLAPLAPFDSTTTTKAEEKHQIKIEIEGVLDKSTVEDAQIKFNKRYSTETEIDTTNIIIPLEAIKEAWFNDQTTDSLNGLVFHYQIDSDNNELSYLVGLGFATGSSLIDHRPFPPTEEHNYYHYYEVSSDLIMKSEGSFAENSVTRDISKDDLDAVHQNYDKEMNRRNWFYIFNRDVENIGNHPNMIHYPFDELKAFYKEYRKYLDIYLEDHSVNIENPKLYLFISNGAYNNERTLKRNFHSPFLRFGYQIDGVYQAFKLTDSVDVYRDYRNKAFDVGVLCPPNCPTEIWPPKY